MIRALIVSLVLVPAAGAETVRFVDGNVFGSEATSFTSVDGRVVEDSSSKPDRTVDLRGGFVVPRLVDGHGHLFSLGRSLSRIDLKGLDSWAAVVARAVERAPSGQGWVLGRGWDQNRWPDTAFPTHERLSEAFPRRPVVLTRVDGHAIIANAEAMRRAGVTAGTADVNGGRVLRGGSKEPTGVFIDAAMPLVRAKIPPFTQAQRKAALTAAFRSCLSVGLTGVHDMGMDAATIRAMKALDAAGRLPIRVYAYTAGVIAGQKPWRGKRFSVVGTKLFADGALGSRGAALLEPYSDEPGFLGLVQSEPAELNRLVRAVRDAGLQPAIHAIGDRGIRAALDALNANRGPMPGRLEHAQVVAAEDFARFRTESVIASMQPTHATSDMPWAEARVGPERIRGGYAWRRMLENRVHLVFGSDFPVESNDPRKGIYAAITRTDERGEPKGGWYPEQRLTVEEALRAFSSDAAAAVADPNAWADFTVFDRDLRTLEPGAIPSAGVRFVVVGGEQVYP